MTEDGTDTAVMTLQQPFNEVSMVSDKSVLKYDFVCQVENILIPIYPTL